MTHASLFTGIGGFDLAAEWCGWENSFQCEINDFCQLVLAKNFPHADRHTDIKGFDARRYRGTVDVLSGGFPCQPFSLAGQRKGNSDDRALWPEMLRVIDEVRPRWIVGENVAGLASLGLDGVLFDLEASGYACETVLLPAAGVGAPHRRDRLWIIAHAGCQFGHRGQADEHGNGIGHGPHSGREEAANQPAGPDAPLAAHAHNERCEERQPAGEPTQPGRAGGFDTARGNDGNAHGDHAGANGAFSGRQATQPSRGSAEAWRLTEPPLCVRHDGLSNWLDRNLNEIIKHHGKTILSYRNEILSEVWRTVSAPPIWEQVRRHYALSSPAVLLEIMQLFTACAAGTHRLPQAGEEAYKDFLRAVRHDRKITGAPHQSGHNGQPAGEYRNAVRELPHEVALAATQIEQWHRTPRAKQLKAYGNSIVPQVAYEIFQAINQIENSRDY